MRFLRINFSKWPIFQNMSINKQLITAVILAGGQGSRLGGLDKGLVELNNTPLAQHLIKRIKPQVNDILLSANRNIERYRELGYEVFEDQINGFAGPLAGILTALKQTQCEWLLTLPADSPFIPLDLVQRLTHELGQSKISIAHDGEQLQPTFALIHRSLVDSLESFLQQGERKTRLWMQQQPYKTTDFSDKPNAFININTADELNNAEIHFKTFMR